MHELCDNYLDSAFEEALSVMAFMSPYPPENDAPPPAPAILTAIQFSGSTSGTLELLTSQAFGVLLATNLLGEEPDASVQAVSAADALRELANVLCGSVLRASGVTKAGSVHMTVPEQSEFDLDHWADFVGEGTILAEVDGFKIALRMT